MSQASRTAATSNNVPSSSINSAGSVSDFEAAIAACGFGCFNICLLIVAMSPLISAIFSTSTLSFILPTAECDLHLNLMQKGVLNAMCFAAIPWGYIADTMGRKMVLVYALLLDGVIVICTGISQTVNQLLIFKFFDGFLVCGPFAVVMSYISEFHGLKHRSRIMMGMGMIKAAATVILPILACTLLPYHFTLEMWFIKLYTWHFFILITAVVPLLGGFLNSFFPESPKFLMSQGRNDEALECLRLVYAINKRRPKIEYPIKNLLDEDPEKTQHYSDRHSKEYKETHKTMAQRRQRTKEQFIEGLRQLRPMCSSPYLKLSLQVYSMLFCILLGLNSIRLWLPQIFVTMVEFKEKNISVISMCTVLQYNYNKTVLLAAGQVMTHCDVHINASSYSDNIVVAIISFFCFLLVTIVVNKLGNNNVLKIALCLAFLSGVTMYFSNSHMMTLILASVFVSSASVSGTTVISVSVNLFPTNMRTMVIIMVMTFGRCGSLLGNILFPYFISLGCIPPFLLIGGVMTVSFVLSLFLPNSNKIALK
ncbi:synaptic vesicle glycoprotein 2B-like isoform X2 [Lucilia sericata]|uniref:synaptic vesicle glycoprotein 2B-like isoform X2 n=1 Tax=Lucilia sericata TaxID=13632 RepID=UPI0018A87793|nr:synaptic vesicle glycoprotein 2B-like isoform X2 [Lucilia sericata]